MEVVAASKRSSAALSSQAPPLHNEDRSFRPVRETDFSQIAGKVIAKISVKGSNKGIAEDDLAFLQQRKRKQCRHERPLATRCWKQTTE